MRTNKRLFASALLLAATVALSGCASGVMQAVDAYGAAAVTGIKATNDSLIAANKTALCATPVSALVRHPELVPAVRSLCVPSKDDGNVGQVLDQVAAAKPGASP